MKGKTTDVPAPLLIGTISDAAALRRYASQPRRARVADLVELRLDRVAAGQRHTCLTTCARLEATGTPVLLTVRLAAEGGGWRSPEKPRRSLFEQALPFVSWIDVELRSPLAAELARAAHAAGKRVVISHHDFTATPTLAALKRIAAAARERGADVVKIATTIRSAADHEPLLALLGGRRDGSLCIIGMGDLGRSLRTYAPTVGSAFAYSYVDTPAAPGQLDVAAMAARLRVDCPAFARRHRPR